MELLRRGETSRIEAKRGTDIGASVMSTVSAFSNERGLRGGYLVFGVVPRQRMSTLFPDESLYEVVGVVDAERLQDTLATQCASMLSSKVRPEITRETVDGKAIVLAFIPEADRGAKPVYITSKGMQGGGFRRIGSTDQSLSTDDVEQFVSDRGGKTFDATPLAGTDASDVDPAALRRFREMHGRTRPDSVLLRANDDELLASVGAVLRERTGGMRPLTIAGLLAFGLHGSLRRELPLIRIDYTRVLGRTRPGAAPSDEVIVTESNEALLLSVEFMVSKIMSDIERRHSLTRDDLVRSETPTLPRLVVREALVNAVMHRSYRTRASVQVRRFPDRLEISNPGQSLSHFENPREGVESASRNPVLADILHDCGLAENRGTGVRRMIQAMKDAGLQPPAFFSDNKRDRFLVRLFLHNLLDEGDLQWLKQFGAFASDGQNARLLVCIRDSSYLDNSTVRDLCDVQDTLRASAILKKLRDRGYIELLGSGNASFYIPAGDLEVAIAKWWSANEREEPEPKTEPGEPRSGASDQPGSGFYLTDGGANVATGGSKVTTGGSKVATGGSKVMTGGSKVADGGSKVTATAADAVASGATPITRATGRRAKPTEVDRVILILCGEGFKTPAELAKELGRSEAYIKNSYLNRLVKEGRLEFAHPGQPNHPQQAYRAARATEEYL